MREKEKINLFVAGSCFITNSTRFLGASPPGKSHSDVISKHRSANDAANDEAKHQRTSRPTWLLALEIVTGTMVGSLFLIALLTALHRCNSKSSIIIPWKKSASEKDHISVYVGQNSAFTTFNAFPWYLKNVPT